MKIILKQGLKSILVHTLKHRGILSRADVNKIARENGYESSNAERRLRVEAGWERLWIKRLNSKKRKAKQSEKIMWFKWIGPKNVFKKV